MLSTDPLFDDLAFALGLGLGGAPGEVVAACADIADGDDDAWHDSWTTTAERLVSVADRSVAAGHRSAVARDTYLRACRYYAIGYHPLFGAPIDERLRTGLARQSDAFAKANALLDRPGEQLEIPFEGTTLPGWFHRAGDGRRPLVVVTNGYDATIYETFLAQTLPVLARGWNCLIFDGPGQGRVLFDQGLYLRADWENVLPAVLDVALARPDVDPARIALTGWSLGGYLALRAASGEHRLAACIADPGLFAMDAGMTGRLRAAGVPEDVIAGYPDLPADVLATVERGIAANRAQRWAIMQRGFMVHGVGSLAEYLTAIAPFTLDGRLADIRCRTLVCAAENDPLSASADLVADEIRAPTTRLTFLGAEGAGDHCEMGSRALYDLRTYDWLAEVFGG
ncbi:alpha/beta hydrolase family protein [Nakamurella sp.]|uniref:alpha/beta hydrolase family protein n=1 Tax=Nakamurella sp. TaxID=1869182 RepID=UPI003784CFC7